MSLRTRSAAFLASMLFLPAAAQAQLKVGDAAPDFTVPTVTMAGLEAKPFTLSAHKGETVILAFFPKARTSGCTMQMESYRDKYAEVFQSGKKVTLIGVSVDPDSALTSSHTSGDGGAGRSPSVPSCVRPAHAAMLVSSSNFSGSSSVRCAPTAWCRRARQR